MADEGSSESKLTRSKRRWADEGRFLTGRHARPETERLPPGQHLVRDWPVLDLGQQPDVPRRRWTLDVDGAVAHKLHWTWDDFAVRARAQVVSDIHCVTTWSRYDNRWEGLPTRDLIDLVAPEPTAAYVVLQSFDGYTTNLPLADFAAADALLAHSWEGRPLTREHGGPVRLVVPHLYLWKSAKWLKAITFRQDDAPGFWEVNGYHRRGDPWSEERYAED